jgi:Zn-dependent alcohol dehydrogenase
MALVNIDQYLESVHTALTNLQTDSELSTPLGGFGYNTAKITGLMTLYDTANAAHLAQKTEYAQQFGATAAYNTAREAAHTAYIRHLTLARVVYKNNVTRTHQLGLQGDRKNSYAGWKAQADQFYSAALAEVAIQTDLATLGVTLTGLQDAKALIDTSNSQFERFADFANG